MSAIAAQLPPLQSPPAYTKDAFALAAISSNQPVAVLHWFMEAVFIMNTYYCRILSAGVFNKVCAYVDDYAQKNIGKPDSKLPPCISFDKGKAVLSMGKMSATLKEQAVVNMKQMYNPDNLHITGALLMKRTCTSATVYLNMAAGPPANTTLNRVALTYGFTYRSTLGILEASGPGRMDVTNRTRMLLIALKEQGVEVTDYKIVDILAWGERVDVFGVLEKKK